MLGRIKNMKLRYKIAAGAATGALVLGGGGAAFAYFTAGGSGHGNASVGTSTTWGTAVVTTDSGTLYPGHGSETLTYTFTNSGSGDQAVEAAQVSAVMKTTNNDIVGPSGEVVGCLASWFTPTVGTPTPGFSTNVAPSGTIAIPVQVVMTDTPAVNQDACKGASPEVDLTIS
jgi:hypothetical protein